MESLDDCYMMCAQTREGGMMGQYSMDNGKECVH